MTKRLAAALSLPLLIALFAAPTANANHSAAVGVVNLLRGGINKQGWGPGYDSSCGTSCSLNIFMLRRDYNQFVRWCGSDAVQVTVPANQTSGYTDCAGGGQWYLRSSVTLLDNSTTSQTPTSHDSPVVVTVHAVQQ
jgi:hypothetical protein